MLPLRDPPHYLQPLKTTTTPKRLMWLDCAGVSIKEQGMYVERWHVGALGTTHYTSKRNARKDALDTYDMSLGLWEAADDYCKTSRRVVLFAYDLAQQLRVSQALVHLPALGWKLDRIVLERTAAWALLRDGKRTLMCCDLKSWCPVELDRIASDVNWSNVEGRTIQAGPDFQDRVCRYRVSVVREAVLQVLNWIEGENLGGFRPTGSGQSYTAYRRRFHTADLLVHDDTERLGLERAAMHTGRCEAWRHGHLASGPYVEYDMHAAYCHIAHECEVPAVAARVRDRPTAAQLERLIHRHAVMADVTVTTSVPAIPTQHAGRTVWPVGTFRTVLWDPELALAMTYADDFKCHRAYTYHRASALHDFAGWVLDGMGAQTNVYGLVPERVLKHWSRCLVGRLGLRFRAWEAFGTQTPPDLRLVTYLDLDEGTSTDMLIAGTDRLILAELAEATESLPQIPGWVMSECRRRLWDAMISVGLDNVVYVDTDSIVVGRENDERVPYPEVEHVGTEWAQKGTYSRMTVNGPRNLTCESTRRVAGLPLSARQVAPLEFTGQIMRSIKESMRAGELDCVTSMPRRWVLDAPDLRRQHLANGRTAPFELQSHTRSEDD